jgi:hypothetical protein
MIRNTEDLLHHYGEGTTGCVTQDDRTLSRRVYKSTDCGAWAALIPPGESPVGTRSEEWTAHVTNSILGPRVRSVRKKGCATVPANDAPAHVRGYLLLTKANQIEGMTWAEVEALDADDIVRVTRGKGLKVTFRMEAPVMKPHAGGVRLGSIVEGSDAEVMPEELMFPFSEADLEQAIENIEAEADFLWHRDNH